MMGIWLLIYIYIYNLFWEVKIVYSNHFFLGNKRSCTRIIDLQEIEFQLEQRNKRLRDITVGPLSPKKMLGNVYQVINTIKRLLGIWAR